MNKKVISFLIIFCCILGLCACNDTTTYVRSENPGAVLITSYDEIVKMKGDNKTFPVLFTLLDCPHCSYFHQMLKTYLNTHEVFIYEVILDLEFNYDEIDEGVKDQFPLLNHAPTLYLVKNNAVFSEFEYKENNDLEVLFDDWIQENMLDRTDN